MYREKTAYGQDPQKVVRSKNKTFNAPLYLAKKYPPGQRIFCCSWSDFFIEEADEWRAEAWDLIARTPNHNYLILTKRPERIEKCLPYDWYNKTPYYPNVWLGVTAENQEQADMRIPILLQIPAAKRFISAEPMLGQVDLTKVGGDRFGWGRIDALNGLQYLRANALEEGCEWETASCAKLDCVICGGETGARARPMHPNWVRSLRDQCISAGVPFFFKQWGEWGWYQGGHPRGSNYPSLFVKGEFDVWMVRVGKNQSGRLLDGREWNGIPEVG
jgi:protein gp37